MAFHRGPKIVTDGLVLALDAANVKSYPGIGATWSDLSGNGNNCILINNTSFTDGSISFDGIDDAGDFTSILDFPDASPFTAQCVINIPYFTGQNLNRVHWLSGVGGNSMMIFRSSLFLMWNESGGVNNLSINYNFPVNQNFHVVITRDSSNIVSLYVNGNYINQGTRSGQFKWATFARLGSSLVYCSRFDLHNMKIYNRALTASEILQNYNATKTRFGL